MGREEIRIEAPVAVAGVTLIPVVQTSLDCWHRTGNLALFGIKQPVSVVVVSPLEIRAFRINGDEVSLDQIVKEAPDIQETLAGISDTPS